MITLSALVGYTIDDQEKTDHAWKVEKQIVCCLLLSRELMTRFRLPVEIPSLFLFQQFLISA